MKNAGNGCLTIADGDFDGDGIGDHAVVLAPKRPGGNAILVVARHQKNRTWSVELLRDWGSTEPQKLYVDPLPAGTYKKTESLEGAVTEPGELEAFTSRCSGLVSGGIESSGVAYFLDGKNWVHVWISD